MGLATNTLYQGDCIARIAELEEGVIDLAFADPPFNIGYEYDVYKDNRDYHEYLAWTRQWMAGVCRALKPGGTFWVAIGDEYAAEFKLIAQNDVRLACRSWVIWYYTFGVNCTRKFSRSHAHLFHFVKDPMRFTFNANDPAIRVPSARQLVYADGRANPKGRLPDDTWILRPQDVQNGFAPDENTWYFPRVAGTFKERAGFHGCQMPEQLLGRIIRASSNEGDVVLDPFAGSGTTLAVAKKLGRKWIGFELSPDYAQKIRARLKSVSVGQPLDGAAEPLLSAPATPTVVQTGRVRSTNSNGEHTSILSSTVEAAKTNHELTKGWDASIVRAFGTSRDGFSVNQMLAHAELASAFFDACRVEGIPGEPKDWNRRLLNLRKANRLPASGSQRSRRLTWPQMDPYAYASEIAWTTMTDNRDVTLDDILCDPVIACEFDRIASSFAPGYTSFEYRWAALAIRKRAHDGRVDAKRLEADLGRKYLRNRNSWSTIPFEDWSDVSGVYLLVSSRDVNVFVGETVDLGGRLRALSEMRACPAWKKWNLSVVKSAAHEDLIGGKPSVARLRALRALLIRRHNPELNFKDLAPKDGVAA